MEQVSVKLQEEMVKSFELAPQLQILQAQLNDITKQRDNYRAQVAELQEENFKIKFPKEWKKQQKEKEKAAKAAAKR